MNGIGQYRGHMNDFKTYSGINNTPANNPGTQGSIPGSSGRVQNAPTIPSKNTGVTLPPGVQGKLVPADQRLQQLQGTYDDKQLKQLGVVECSTCANRTYQDDSHDGSVSMQTPTKLSPSEAPAAVMGHEMEHVVNEQQNAKAEGREVVSQSVQIHTSICPECGRSYVAGGVTKTTTRAKQPSMNQMKNTVGGLMDLTF